MLFKTCKSFINISASYSVLYIYLINFIVLLWDVMQYSCLRFSMTREFVERAFYLQGRLSQKRFPPFSKIVINPNIFRDIMYNDHWNIERSIKCQKCKVNRKCTFINFTMLIYHEYDND